MNNTQTIAQALAWGTQSCRVLASSHSGAETTYSQHDARSDAKVLLCAVLAQTPTYLATWPDRHLSEAQFDKFHSYIKRRMSGEPVAFITGVQAFYEHEFAVSPCTLIPRPETELLVDTALSLLEQQPGPCLDLGTGTGAIAISIAAARPDVSITAVDVVEEAVTLAKHNAQKIGVSNVDILQSSWFEHVQGRFSVIVTNPPYVEPDSPYLDIGDLRFEPNSALSSSSGGYADIEQIIRSAPNYLRFNGWLAIEHGNTQAEHVQTIFTQNGFSQVQTVCDYAKQPRLTYAQWVEK